MTCQRLRIYCDLERYELEIKSGRDLLFRKVASGGKETVISVPFRPVLTVTVRRGTQSQTSCLRFPFCRCCVGLRFVFSSSVQTFFLSDGIYGFPIPSAELNFQSGLFFDRRYHGLTALGKKSGNYLVTR